MGKCSVSYLLILLFMSFIWGSQLSFSGVTYDNKSIVINGQRKILISGSIHYPRSTPEMWEQLIKNVKGGGLDVIDTYVFWNGHEPSPRKYYFEDRYDLVKFIKTVQSVGLYVNLRIGPYVCAEWNFGGFPIWLKYVPGISFRTENESFKYYFEDRYDLVKFIKTVQSVGLYVNLRIGPYVCAEWNFGGFPVWLKYVPGISFRTDNEPFKRAMQSFTQKIVQMMQSEQLFASQGGPIILAQIENEYGSEVKQYGAAGKSYVNWAAKMAVGLNTGVPWVMCKEDDAPDPVINTCNGFYCDHFKPNKPNKPLMWTEAWSGWFTEFGGPIYQRPVEDLAFAVARFVQGGGSFFNYYMYHGGTNFERTAGGPFITTSYDYDAPIDEYGLIRQPKYGHLKNLHRAIKLSEQALLYGNLTVTTLRSYQQAHVFSTGRGICAAFLSNFHQSSPATVTFNNVRYDLPAWSISILPDCRNVAFNTARLGAQTSNMQMLPANTRLSSWETYNEDLSSLEDRPTLRASGLLDQINVTRDRRDYLWYTTNVEVSDTDIGGQSPSLLVESTGHALHVFINGKFSGSTYGTRKNRRFTFRAPVKLRGGVNSIALLSIAVGLPNLGPRFETWKTGILGPVVVHGLTSGKRDLTWEKWAYQVGLKGESMNLVSPHKASSDGWLQGSKVARSTQPLTWYKANFNAPGGTEPLAIDMQSMGKGQMWINGQSIGRYWTDYAKGNCKPCSYAGTYRPSNKCQSGCGSPTQRWYHVPRSWLKPTQNLMVIFEETDGDVTKISIVKRSVAQVCADAYEHDQTTLTWQLYTVSNPVRARQAKIHLQCGLGQSISSIQFASFGNPTGGCGSLTQGTCHAQKSHAVIEKMCVGREKCSVVISNTTFGEDPCPSMLKRLSVKAICS